MYFVYNRIDNIDTINPDKMQFIKNFNKTNKI